MPIMQFFDSSKFDPETNRVMGVAFEMALAALQLGDQSNLWERIAKRIIELAKTGELNPDLLCEAVLSEFRSTCRQRLQVYRDGRPRNFRFASTSPRRADTVQRG